MSKTEKIQRELTMLEEDLLVVKTEIEKADKQYNRDMIWDRKSADRGYPESLYNHLHSNKDQIELLKRLLKDD